MLTNTFFYQAIQAIFINLVDLHMEVRLQGSRVYETSKESTRIAIGRLTRFKSRMALARYCVEEGKIFPLNKAKGNFLSKCLLRIIQ